MPGRTLARCANCCTRCERRSYSEPNPKFRVERRAVCRPDQRRKQCFSPVDPSSVKALSRESKQSLNWPRPRPVGNSCDISIVWRTGLRENEMYWGHLLDEAFCLSTQFDLSPLSFACVPAWARPTETRSGPRLIRVSQNWPMPTSFGVIVLLTELLQAQIQIEV